MPKAKKKAATPRRTPRKSPPDGEAVRFEQFRQKVLTEAVEAARKVQQEELSKIATVACRLKIQPELLDHELMMGVLGLDWQQWPKEKLEVIKAAYIVNGTMESGGAKLVIPKGAGGDTSMATSVYASIFDRKAPEALPESQNAPVDGEDGVFDIIPGAVKPKIDIPKGFTMPSSGEAIDEPKEKTPSNPRVITVEIG